MSLNLAVDQPEGGVRFIAMDRLAPLERLIRWVGYRGLQIINVAALRYGVRLMETRPGSELKFLAYRRTIHDQIPAWRRRAEMAMIEAVRTLPPHPAMQSPPVPSDWFAPVKGEPKGFVFYVHGGSFVAGRSPRVTAMVARLTAAAGARVFAPNYRLAPEHPCPAAVDDVVAAFHWFRATWPDEPVVALAESAGAAILLAALQQVKAQGGQLPDGVVLLSPWVDVSLQSWSVIVASLAGTSPYTMECLAVMAHLYLQGQPATDAVASPLYGDFAGFPPMLIHASKGDILYDDATRLAERVRDAGGDLAVRFWAAETHVWERKPSPKARQSLELAADFIRRRLEQATAGRGKAN
jgi:monoterpene epsilon-lactone hydrolase